MCVYVHIYIYIYIHIYIMCPHQRLRASKVVRSQGFWKSMHGDAAVVTVPEVIRDSCRRNQSISTCIRIYVYRTLYQDYIEFYMSTPFYHIYYIMRYIYIYICIFVCVYVYIKNKYTYIYHLYAAMVARKQGRAQSIFL